MGRPQDGKDRDDPDSGPGQDRRGQDVVVAEPDRVGVEPASNGIPRPCPEEGRDEQQRDAGAGAATDEGQTNAKLEPAPPKHASTFASHA